MKILGVITARKGSKRLPSKNFRMINGRSLAITAVEQACKVAEAGLLSEVVLSTDSEYLLEQCRRLKTTDLGLRPEELSGDRVGSAAVISDILQKLQSYGKTFDAVMILQPTSPLRTIEDISCAIQEYAESGKDSLISAYRIPNATPNGLYLKSELGFIPLCQEHNSGNRHQDLPPVYLRNGAIFISDIDLLREGKIIGSLPAVYEMPEERSRDIDTEEDIAAATAVFRRSHAAFCCETVDCWDYEELEHFAQTAWDEQKNLVVPAILRQWLYSYSGQCNSIDLHFLDRHVYFDGAAVLIDGERVASLAKFKCAMPIQYDHTLEDWIRKQTGNLTQSSDCLLINYQERRELQCME